MSVPIPIVITSCLLTTVLVWIMSTHDKNFTTFPTPEQLVNISREWEKNRPNIPPPKPINASLLENKPINAPKRRHVQPETNTLPIGNLQHAPTLTEYATFGNQDAQTIVKIATQLETMGELQRALLAWERVIDTANPNNDERTQAITAIRRIRPTLPPWNPNPASDIVITLRAGATPKDKKSLENALTKVANLISEASGNIIHVNAKASFGKNRNIKTPRTPIAIWFSRPGKPSAETPPISFMANPNKKGILASQIETSVYTLLRAHLAQKTHFSPLPEHPAGVKPEDLLNYHVTRLMWREFVNSMKE